MNANAPKYQPSNGKLSAVTPIPLTDFLTMLEKTNSGIVQNPTLILSDRQHSNPILGEQRAGTVVDIRTGVVYDVMLLPGELTCVTWAEAKASINAAGGDLPTPVEMLMLNGLLGRLAFQDSYWTDEKVKFDGDADDSISYFSDGVFDFSDASDRMSARGIRRISIGDVADENLDEVDDNTVIVPAPAIPAKAGTSASESWGLAAAPAVTDNRLPAQERAEAYSNGKQAGIQAGTAMASWSTDGVVPDSGLTLEKMTKLVSAQRRACDLLEANGVPAQFETAGALRSAICDMWDAAHEQVSINALPVTLDNWMTTPAGLARVLVDALRKERIAETGEYNDAVEDCIVAVIGTLSAGAGADTAQKWAELSAMAPKVPVDDVAGVLAQLRGVADQASDDDPAGVCRRAIGIIEGLLPHAGAGVEA